MGILRPDKEHPKRFLFNYAHRSLGITLLVLSSNFNKYVQKAKHAEKRKNTFEKTKHTKEIRKQKHTRANTKRRNQENKNRK